MVYAWIISILFALNTTSGHTIPPIFYQPIPKHNYRLCTGHRIFLQPSLTNPTKLILDEVIKKWEQLCQEHYDSLLRDLEAFGISELNIALLSKSYYKESYMNAVEQEYQFNDTSLFTPSHKAPNIVMHFIDRIIKQHCPDAPVRIYFASHISEPVILFGTQEFGFYLIVNSNYYNIDAITTIMKQMDKGGIIGGIVQNNRLQCYIDYENLLTLYLVTTCARMNQDREFFNCLFFNILRNIPAPILQKISKLQILTSCLPGIIYNKNPMEAAFFLYYKLDDSLRDFFKPFLFDVASCYQQTSLDTYNLIRKQALDFSKKS